MIDASGKPISLHAKKTRKARLRRLEILRMRSAAHGRAPDPVTDTDGESLASSIESSEDVGAYVKSGESSPSRCKSSGLLYGYVSVMGRRRVMEDAVTVAPLGWLAGEYSFFAVYDGHGGGMVAEKCRDRMHKSLERVIDKAKTLPEGKGIVWPKVMAECFNSMDKELLEEDAGDEAETAAEQSGGGRDRTVVEEIMDPTAVVVVVGKEDVVVANCGDSRAVLCRGGAAVPLSRDHKVTCNRFSCKFH